jgi:nucleoside-diphosphate-sugar epimerase
MHGRALVTGVAGFVGSHVARVLAAEGWQVVGVARPGSDASRLISLPPEVSIEALDLGDDALAVANLVRRVAPRLVVHAAARGAYATRDLVAGVRDDVLGLAHLLAALPASGCRLIALGGSLETRPSDAAVDEAQPLGPTSTRGTLRAAATLLVLDEARARRLEAGILRVFSVYGPGEAPHRLVPQSVRAALLGESLPLTAPPWPTHDFVYVEDVAEACLAAARAPAFPGKVWNVCTGVATSDLELVDAVERVVGRTIERRPGAWRSAHPERLFWCGDPSATAAGLGWRARFALDAGLALTADWWRPRLAAHGA